MSRERWHYRFESFSKALEQEGVIQRFEYTWELSWNVMKDFLEHHGLQFELITPSFIIKKAFAAELYG